MGRFLNGFLVGVGVGLLIAPMRGEEMQRLLRERWQELSANLPERDQLMRTGQQVAANLSQTASTLKDYAQQAASKVQDTGNTLGDLAQQSAQKVKQSGQSTVNTTKQTMQ
jgi:gas vesicle protein